MNNIELNNAIYTVLTTKYKKDAKEAFKMVEAAGYNIDKCNGYFEVGNNKTKKYIRIYREFYSYRENDRMIVLYGLKNKDTVTHSNFKKIDFVNLLNTPTNVEYYGRPRNRSKFVEAAENIKRAKWMIKSYNKDIDKTKKEIEELTNRLVWYTTQREYHTNDLKNIRKEYNLKSR